jgi:hypothetical protein
MSLKPKILLKCFILLMVLLIDGYLLMNGLEALPDYDGYFIMAGKNLDGLSDGGAFLELIPKMFLGGILTSGQISTDIAILTGLSQLFTIFFYIVYKPKGVNDLNMGMFLVAGLTGPFFLTTAIRAAPAYLLSAMVFCNGVNPSVRSLFLLSIAALWHDTSVVSLVVCLVAFISEKKLKQPINFIKKSSVRLMLLFTLIGSLLKLIVQLTPIDLLAGFLGYRAVYITSNNETFLKELFIIIVVLMGIVCIRKCQLNTRQTFWIIMLSIATILVSLVNQVAGVRISFYIIVAAVPMFRVEDFIKISESVKLYMAIIIFLCLTTFSLWDLNRNYYRNLDAAVNHVR